MPALVPSPPFECRALPGKGIGIVATSFIPAETLLVTAPPLFLIKSAVDASPGLITAAFEALPTNLSRAYLDLFPAPDAPDPVLGVWKANNFCLDSQGIVNGVFDLPSRFNHSCLGGDNARWEWDEEEDLMRFYTDRDIEVSLHHIVWKTQLLARVKVTTIAISWGRTDPI